VANFSHLFYLLSLCSRHLVGGSLGSSPYGVPLSLRLEIPCALGSGMNGREYLIRLFPVCGSNHRRISCCDFSYVLHALYCCVSLCGWGLVLRPDTPAQRFFFILKPMC
jgi:hypothetical protein